MRTRNRFYVIVTVLLIVAVVSVGFRPQSKTVGQIIKVVKEVFKNNDIKAKGGEVLASGDEVRTGVKSFAMVKFLDNSIVRVREKSKLSISQNGDVKSADLKEGGFGFKITRQSQNQKFIFTSPTSVASIRGTAGKLSTDGEDDILVVTEGLVNFKNTVSGSEVDVSGGNIGFSNNDGTITTRKATEEELADAKKDGSDDSKLDVEINLKNPKGEEGKLKIHKK